MRSQTTADPPRRTPKQHRSRAKVDAILAAADELVAERGTAALTTTSVAAGAGVAIGSLYQYFDSVAAILDALVGMHARRFGDLLRDELASRTFRRKREAANAALDTLIGYYRSNASFRALWQGAPHLTSAGFILAGDSLAAMVVDELVAQGLARHDDADFVRESQVQVAVAEALIMLAFRRDPDGDPAVLAHLRRLFDLDVPATSGPDPV